MTDRELAILCALAEFGQSPVSVLSVKTELSEKGTSRLLKGLARQDYAFRCGPDDWDITVKGCLFVGEALSERTD